MGYYHFKLSEQLAEMCTFMLPFGMYRYKRLPMGLSISPDFFQKCMTQLFGDLPFVKCYLDDIAIFSNGTYEDHMEKVSIVLQHLKEKGLQINARKCFWAQQEVDYLGFVLTPGGVKPQVRKVDAIRRIQPPKTRKQLRRFIGMSNYYRYMWQKRSHMLTPLTALLRKGARFKWTDEAQKGLTRLNEKSVQKYFSLSQIMKSLLIFMLMLLTTNLVQYSHKEASRLLFSPASSTRRNRIILSARRKCYPLSKLFKSFVP